MPTKELQTLSAQYEKLAQETEQAFSRLLDNKETAFILEGQLLETCLKNQVTLQVEWEHYLARASALEKQLDHLKENYFSYAFAKAMKNSNKTLQVSEAKYMANCDDDYIEAVKLYNKVYKTKKEVEGVVSTLTTRQFMLKHISEAVIAGVNKHIIS